MHDLRYGLRTLARQPGFTLVAVLSLALGIGLNTTIFSVVNTILLRNLPVEDPDRLVELYTSPSEEFPHLTTSYLDYEDLRDETDVFTGLAAHAMVRGIVTYEGSSELVAGEVITENYFDVLGVELALGRTFLPEENRTEGTHPVLIASHGLWQRRLAGDPSVLGETLELSGIDYTVVGVAPREFTGTIPGLVPEFWAPMAMVERLGFSGIQTQTPSPVGETRLEQRGTRWLFVKGRLREGAGLEEAQAQVDTVLARLETAYPETNENVAGVVMAGGAVRFHPMVDGVLSQAGTVLLVAVGMVLLIACANVANMLLARAGSRGREIAVRLSVGASRGRLVRQLLTESLLLSLVSGIVGVTLAVWALPLLSGLTPPLPLPVQFAYELDANVLLYATLVSVFTALVFGLVPAFRASRPSLVPALKGEAASGGQTGRRVLTLGNALVVGQLAVSLVLLVAGALLVRGLIEAHRVDLGFDASRVAALSFDLEMNNYTIEEAVALQRELLEALPSLPGVELVSFARRMPLSPDINMEAVAIRGHHDPDDEPTPIDATYVGEDYFRVVGVPIVEGRSFRSSDREGTPGVVVINETMAKRYWPGRSAVGEHIYPGGFESTSYEIVGVARDHKIRSVGEEPRSYIHFARGQSPSRSTGLVVRTGGPPANVIPVLKREILAREPAIVFTEETTAEEIAELTLTPTKVGAGLLGAFGFLALLLAAVGLYGVIAYSVSRRVHELGLRMALGARSNDVLGLVLRQGMWLTAVGLGVGAVLAALLARVLQSLLYGVSALDPIAYGAAALLLGAVALAANFIPAWRSARIHPMTALHHE